VDPGEKKEKKNMKVMISGGNKSFLMRYNKNITIKSSLSL
jgi:hypothetical protein